MERAVVMAEDELRPQVSPEDRRAGLMSDWTKKYGKTDSLNPWSRQRFDESAKIFLPLEANFYLMTWDGRESSIGPHFPPTSWSTGTRRYNIGAGDRVVLLRQTVKPIGIVAIGRILGPAQEVPHLDPLRAEFGHVSLVAPIQWDHFESEPVVLREDVPEPIRSAINWAASGSGITLGSLGLFLDQEFRAAIRRAGEDDQAAEEIAADPTIGPTERQALAKARIGQGKFRENVLDVERTGCRLTGVTDVRLLRASHIKPWAKCSNSERLDGHNGLMLTPSADHLFDKGFISFSEEGQILVATDYIEHADLKRMGLMLPGNVGPFSRRQKLYLVYHRENVFKG